MLKFFFLIFLSLNFINFIVCLQCNRFNRTLNHVFVTKSNYNDSLIYFNSSNLDNLELNKCIPSTCKIDQFYLLQRHSTRNPSLKSTKSMRKLFSKFKESLFKEFNKEDVVRTDCEYYLFYHLNKSIFRYQENEAGLMVKIGDKITSEIGLLKFLFFSKKNH